MVIKDMKEHKYKYEWNLKDAVFTKDKGKVFSCFACGGGSTMGYKLSGFDVLGCNEIDPKMIEAYRKNHKPKYSFLESITTFKDRKDLPEDLYNLDILDGSPPCSSFSMASCHREKGWGKQKKFREGQSLQVLDTLFFDFIDLAKELKPKVVIAENVKGLLMGQAKEYVEKIYKAFDEAGYYCQHFLLNSAKMSVPQRRERVFFISLRKDLAKPFMKQKDLFNNKPKINLDFNEPGILFEEIYDGLGKPITEYKMKAFECRQPNDNGIADSKRHAGMKVSDYNCVYVKHDKVMPTITGKAEHAMLLYNEPIKPSDTELRKGGTYPMDYEFSNIGYLIGMSVPPVMTAQVADRIYDQWLSKIK